MTYHVQSNLRCVLVTSQVHGLLLSTKDKKICAVLSQDADQADQENLGVDEGATVAEVQALYQLTAGVHTIMSSTNIMCKLEYTYNAKGMMYTVPSNIGKPLLQHSMQQARCWDANSALFSHLQTTAHMSARHCNHMHLVGHGDNCRRLVH